MIYGLVHVISAVLESLAELPVIFCDMLDRGLPLNSGLRFLNYFSFPGTPTFHFDKIISSIKVEIVGMSILQPGKTTEQSFASEFRGTKYEKVLDM